MKEIEELKTYIKNKYEETRQVVEGNKGSEIYRGHSRSLSTDIEDAIAIFISKLLPSCKVFIDPSISIGGKKHRPDILIIDKNNETIGMIEVKSNMGWCRNASDVIANIKQNNIDFSDNTPLRCEFSEKNNEDMNKEEPKIVKYGNDVKLFLVSFTKDNCSDKKHDNNKDKAIKANVSYFTLFSGWYGSLVDCDIYKFAEELMALKNRLSNNVL